MLLRGVVRDEVNDDPQAQLVRPRHEGVRIGEGAEVRVDVAVVADVVSAVGHGGGIPRRDPQSVDTQSDEVVEVVNDATHVANAVCIRVSEAAWVNLVDDGGFPPVDSRGGSGHGILMGLCGVRKTRRPGLAVVVEGRSVGANFATVT